MELYDSYYYRTCKNFLSITGLWPYLSDRRRKISCIIFYAVNMTLVIPTYIEWQQKFGKDFNVTVENFVSLMFTAGCCIKYIIAYTSINELKALFEQIARDWQEISLGVEKQILVKNTEQGRFLVSFYTVYVAFGWIIYINLPFIPRVVDVVFPLNESRPLLMPFFANYIFFEQSEHHLFSCIHLGVVYLTSAFIFGGVDNTFVITVKHTCGLFNVISYRLESFIVDNEKEDITHLENNKDLIKRVREVIIMHKNSLKCAELLEDTFNTGFLLLNSMCILGLALAVVYILIIFGDYLKCFRIVVFGVGLVINLFYINYVGQMIIDNSEKIFISTYFSNWYLTSNSIRRTIGIMMLRALFPCQLTAGKISILCTETFGILMKATVSYVTVFLSVM